MSWWAAPSPCPCWTRRTLGRARTWSSAWALQAFFLMEAARPGEGEGPEPQAGDADLGLELDVDKDDEYLLS